MVTSWFEDAWAISVEQQSSVYIASASETYVESDQSCVTISGAALQGRHVRPQSANSTAANMADTPTRNGINERLVEVDIQYFSNAAYQP